MILLLRLFDTRKGLQKNNEKASCGGSGVSSIAFHAAARVQILPIPMELFDYQKKLFEPLRMIFEVDI